MESLWGNLTNFTADVRNPKEILQEQASIFNNIEENRAHIEVIRRRLTEAGKKNFRNYYIDDLEGDFVYSFELKSTYLADYRYEVFTIFYGIKFYPVCLQLSAGIARELDSYLEDITTVDDSNHRYLIESETIFNECLKKILSTDELRTIIKNVNLLAMDQEEIGDIVLN